MTPAPHAFSAAPAAQPVRVTVLGDSVGWVLAGSGVPTNVKVTNAALLGCGASLDPYYFGDFVHRFPTTCDDVDARWREASQGPTDAVMVFLGSWDVFDRRVAGQRLEPTTARWSRWFRTDLLHRLGRWLDAPDGPPIYLVRLACPITDVDRLGVGAWERADPDRVRAFNRAIDQVAAARPDRIDVIGYEDVACTPSGGFRTRFADGEQIRPDGLHPDPLGAAAIWHTLLYQMDGARPR